MGSPEPKTQNFKNIRNLIKTKLVELGTPSLAVAIAQNSRIIWEEGFGWADRENRVPANQHTMYSLASITKIFTATELMILNERNKLDLDHLINDYLGDAKVKVRVSNSDEATVRQVANHSSGLPLHYQFFYEDESHRPPQMVETIRRYGNLVTAPGERIQYSNLGYGILDYMISRLSGKSYIDFMREKIFLPLGMTHTSVYIGPRLEKYQAIRYGTDGLPLPFYDFDFPGAGSIYSSAHDLVKFGMFHLKAHLTDQKDILSDESIEEMQRPTMIPNEGQSCGVGWWIIENDGGYRNIGHGGGMPGVNTRFTLIPSEKLAIVVLANARSTLPSLVVQKILSTLLPEYEKKRELLKSEEKEQASSPVFKPNRDLIGKWSGTVHTYKGEIPLTLWFKESGDVHVQLGNQLKTLLNDISFKDNYFRGQMMGNLGTEDLNRRPYYLQVDMKIRGQVLNGSIIAVSWEERRSGFGLSHWVEIKKE